MGKYHLSSTNIMELLEDAHIRKVHYDPTWDIPTINPLLWRAEKRGLAEEKIKNLEMSETFHQFVTGG